MAVLELTDAEHEMGQAVLGVEQHEPARQIERLIEVAVGQRCNEGPLDQFGVARIGAQRLAEEGRRRGGVPIGAGHERGQIVAAGAAADLERVRDRDDFTRLRPRGGGAGDRQSRQGGVQARRAARRGAGLELLIGHGCLCPCETVATSLRAEATQRPRG